MSRIQDNAVDLENLPLNDTLLKTLKGSGLFLEDGMNKNDSNYPVFNFGTFNTPQGVIEANTRKLIAVKEAEANDFDNFENSKKANYILAELLIDFLPKNRKKTIRELRVDAVRNIGTYNPKNDQWETIHRYEQDIAGEIIKLLLNSGIEISPKEISELREKSETGLNIREKRTDDNRYTGLGNANTMVNLKNK